ncbi:hypothetical protein [Hyunsoonleella pacifica]|uniref:Uncharacterized protein n=1 Tax=Hyunsoonleella pacifica TaxID=1080224 RepID=A0A4Q9FSD3_9FLAO|nr:hypothetical protein [Hyunsoonleella pacifica]TBN19028.1 hypothetical protein EYD46_02890 [Hyunsoonleella pacifica]
MKLKKTIKIILGVVIFLTLPSLLFFGFLYFKHHQDLPNGTEGKAADDLATKMLVALNYEAYTSTDYIEWTFKNRRHYEWDKTKSTCDVFWKDYKIRLDLKDHTESKAFVHGFTIEGEMGQDLVDEAKEYFKNDVFWLIAPFQAFDKGVSRKLVVLPDDEKALLITYSNEASYLWRFDDSGKPKSFNMWDSNTPIDGLSASWNDWQIVETGMKLPKFHKILFFGMEISDIKTD